MKLEKSQCSGSARSTPTEDKHGPESKSRGRRQAYLARNSRYVLPVRGRGGRLARTGEKGNGRDDIVTLDTAELHGA